MSEKSLKNNIRNRIRRFYAVDLMLKLLPLIQRSNLDTLLQNSSPPPWYMLLLFKWIVIYGNYDSEKINRDVESNEIMELLRRIDQIPKIIRKPNEYRNNFLFIRNISYQQFWLQEPFFSNKLARQFHLLGRLERHHKLQKMFFHQTNLYIDEFTELLYVLIARLIYSNEIYVDVNWFSTIAASYREQTILNFLNSLSLSIMELRSWLISLEQNKHEAEKQLGYEFFEQTPLYRYPLLRIQDRYYCYSPKLLYSVGNLVYDIFREQDADEFMGKFGDIFEKYIGELILSTQVKHLNETALKKKFPGQGQKYVDFVIQEEGRNIFIESKSVSFEWSEMVTHQPGTIRRATRDSILKAVGQANNLAKRMANEGVNVDSLEKNYLLIVTAKDLYLGNGLMFEKILASAEQPTSLTTGENKNWIPISNIYFLSIDEFEVLVTCMNATGRSFFQFLDEAIAADSHPTTSKFLFQFHLEQACKDHRSPEILNTSMDELEIRLASRFGVDIDEFRRSKESM